MQIILIEWFISYQMNPMGGGNFYVLRWNGNIDLKKKHFSYKRLCKKTETLFSGEKKGFYV
jgi:hypothetical protein